MAVHSPSNTNSRSAVSYLITIVCAFFLSYLLFALFPGVFDTWELQTYDRLHTVRASISYLQPPYNQRVVHVDISNQSVRQAGNYYFDRSHFAEAVSALNAMQVAAQMWDFVLAAKIHPESDEALINATRRSANVYFGLANSLQPKPLQGPSDTEILAQSDSVIWNVAVDGSDDRFFYAGNLLPTFSMLASSAKGMGSLSVRSDRDGVLRKVPLLLRYKDGYIPMLPLRVVCDYLGVGPGSIVVSPGRHIFLTGARSPGSNQTKDIRIPIDDRCQMTVAYCGPWDRVHHYDFFEVISALHDQDELEMWVPELQGKIAIVANVTTGSSDIGSVPIDAAYPFVGVHANVINAILTESFIKQWRPPTVIALEVFLLLGVWVLARRFSSISFSIGCFLLTIGFLAIVVSFYLLAGIQARIVQPTQMVVFAVVAILVLKHMEEERQKLVVLKQREEIRSTFGRYISDEVASEILSAPGSLAMGGELRQVTFLVSDIRGFTSISNHLSPQRLVSLLNHFLTHMIAIIKRHSGTVDEIRGDGLLVFFGAPIVYGDEEYRAVACAIDMQNGMEQLNSKLAVEGFPKLQIGISIHTGEVVVGNIGSLQRAKYSAVGSAINTAFRIESYTVGGQVLISRKTFQAVADRLKVHRRMSLDFKGASASVTVFDVEALQSVDGEMRLSAMDQQFQDLDRPCPLKCYEVHGKSISKTPFNGMLTAIGATGVKIQVEKELSLLSDIKLLLDIQREPSPIECYGKVTELTDKAPLTVVITLTSYPDNLLQLIQDAQWQDAGADTP